MSHIGARVAKSVTGIMGNRWPETTAKLAFRLFSRVPRTRPSARNQLADISSAMLQTMSGVVATWELKADNPTGKSALLVHGWNSRSEHMMTIARDLLAAGIDVVLLDLPGHGASSGRHLHLGKGVAAVDAAWRNHGPFTAFIGHSFGGVVALNAALGTSMCLPARNPERLVMIAAPNSMPALFRWFGQKTGLPARAQDALERKVLHIMGRVLDFFVCSDQLRETEIPVLVVHDRDDKDVFFGDALKMNAAGPHVSLHATNGLGHRRVLKDKSVLAAVRDHVLAEPEVKSEASPTLRLVEAS